MNDTEQHRCECEARFVLKHSKEWRTAHYAGVREKRGAKGLDKLITEVNKQYKLSQSQGMEI